MAGRIVELAAVVLSLVSALLGSGCFRYVQSHLTVIDADTGRPLADAPVKVWYNGWPLGPMINGKSDQGVTDESGRVDLRVTASSMRQVYPIWSCRSRGYYTIEEPSTKAIESAIRSGQREIDVEMKVSRQGQVINPGAN